MWSEKLSNGKIKYCERYKDPLTLKYKRVSVTLDKDSITNRKIAAAELHKKIDNYNNLTTHENITFNFLKEAYLSYQKNEVKLSTLTRNSISLAKSIDIIGPDVIIDNVSASYIMERFRSHNFSNGKINQYLIRLKAMLRWGYRNDYFNNGKLVEKLTLLKDTSPRSKVSNKYLESDELQALLNELNHEETEHWYLLTKFLVLSGLRIGELISLENSDVEKNYIIINKTYDLNNNIITPPKTSTSNREVFIQPELRNVIQQIIKFQKIHSIAYGFRTNLFFSNNKGSYISYDAYRICLSRAAQKTIGRKITPHVLRHTHASMLLANGINIDTISRRLGHDGSKITKEIYLHITKKLKELDNAQLSNINII